ncbi:MAG: hypothetical protein QOH05_2079, partial [Acetobacteraceae bacterium]|nr:hypothetical protein [Acetobacteraceae bacterium]
MMEQAGCHRLRRWMIVGAALASGLTPYATFAASSHAAANVPMLPPVEPACVSSPFGPRSLPNKPLAGTFHNGIDLPAPIGSPVVAVAPGT